MLWRLHFGWALPLVLLGLSCSTPDINELPPVSPERATPVASGLWITSTDGPDIVGVWRNPQGRRFPTRRISAGSVHQQDVVSTGEVPDYFEMQVPYPNPCQYYMSIEFSLATECEVTCWIVPARWIEDNTSDIGIVGGAAVNLPNIGAIRTPLRNRPLVAGRFLLEWDGRDDRGQFVPPGFYRIYLQMGESVLWQDTFVFGEWSDLPGDLRSFVEAGYHWSPQ